MILMKRVIYQMIKIYKNYNLFIKLIYQKGNLGFIRILILNMN